LSQTSPLVQHGLQCVIDCFFDQSQTTPLYRGLRQCYTRRFSISNAQKKRNKMK